MLKLINEFVLGPALVMVVTVGSIALLLKLRFKPFNSPLRMIKKIMNVRCVRTACLSLAGALGVGNITGVAAAISSGGAGAIFWMWCFSVMACVIKYSEVILAHEYKTKDSCGASYYIQNGIGSKRLGIIFSVLLLMASVGMGNMVQSSSASDGLYFTFGIPRIVTGVVFCITTIILISGGRERVSGFSSVIIPILSVCYVVFSLAILFVNARMIPGVFRQVLREGTNVSAMSGGLLGFLTSKAVRLGASRGILSNEAGCGTASYAQDPNESDVASGAVWGVIEVIVDTLLLCSLTALVLLVAPSGNSEPMKSVIDSYSFFAEIGGYFIGISAGLYGLSSVVCWSYYGIGAVKYLGGKKRACILYVIIYSIAGLLGSVFKSELVWDISDLTVSVMAIFNTVCVILLSGKVKKRTEECFS